MTSRTGVGDIPATVSKATDAMVLQAMMRSFTSCFNRKLVISKA
jgi:hypothetical protein